MSLFVALIVVILVMSCSVSVYAQTDTPNIGTVSWSKKRYPANEFGIIQVIDKDRNSDSQIDWYPISIFSDTDKAGLIVTATETDKSSSILEAKIFFTDTGNTIGNRLRVSAGDNIYAQYDDSTLPDPYGNTDMLQIVGTALITEPSDAGISYDTMNLWQQRQLGFPTEKLHCKDGLVLATKTDYEDPVCLKETTLAKLASRGLVQKFTEPIQDNTKSNNVTVELDKKIYTWTDWVSIKITSPGDNLDSNVIDEIGNRDSSKLRIYSGNTRVYSGNSGLNNYKLVETGPDTGVFAGQINLVGTLHDANGQEQGGMPKYSLSGKGEGPSSGNLEVGIGRGITASYEYLKDKATLATALVQWNLGMISWLDGIYSENGHGKIRVNDPDLNLRPDESDTATINVKSTSDEKGIFLVATETGKSTGVFTGTVLFTTGDSDQNSFRLKVVPGDVITATYSEFTLPYPYQIRDQMDITNSTLIGFKH